MRESWHGARAQEEKLAERQGAGAAPAKSMAFCVFTMEFDTIFNLSEMRHFENSHLSPPPPPFIRAMGWGAGNEKVRTHPISSSCSQARQQERMKQRQSWWPGMIYCVALMRAAEQGGSGPWRLSDDGEGRGSEAPTASRMTRNDVFCSKPEPRRGATRRDRRAGQ